VFRLVVAFVTSILISLVLTAVVVWYMGKRPAGTPLTWGEAMAGSVYVFFLLFWVYGIVPHQWLTWADNELGWRPDKLVYGPGDILKPVSKGGWVPFTITYRTIRDIVAVAIYGVLLVANVALWMMWQNRGKKASTEVVTSDYGRPLVREGVS
jgi:hypothetical protein